MHDCRNQENMRRNSSALPKMAFAYTGGPFEGVAPGIIPAGRLDGRTVTKRPRMLVMLDPLALRCASMSEHFVGVPPRGRTHP